MKIFLMSSYKVTTWQLSAREVEVLAPFALPQQNLSVMGWRDSLGGMLYNSCLVFSE